MMTSVRLFIFFFQAEDGIRDVAVTGVQTCALPICPLHWEKWKDAHEALGQIPYVKGALFLDRLRTELGDEIFWRGIGLYTSGNARRLVDSREFERAVGMGGGRRLEARFDEAVYRWNRGG